jgi:hypothetical protein
MECMPAAIDQATRTAVTARITAHVKRGWPCLRTPPVRFRGQFCYVDAVLPGHREPTPILRLRYQGSTDRWDIGIYLTSDERYTESELPTSFGPRTGTPEEGIDHTFILYAGPPPNTDTTRHRTNNPANCETQVITDLAIDGEVVLAAQPVVPYPGRLRHGAVELRPFLIR